MTASRAEAAIAQEDLDALDADGAVRLTEAIPMSWVETLRQGVERGVREPGPLFGDLGGSGQPGGFYVDTWTRERIPEFNAFVRESGIARIAASCLGEPKVRLMQDTWFVKRPGTIERTPWHHDNVIFGPFLSIWVALDPIPRESSLEFVRGSHAWKRYFMPKRYFQGQDGDGELPDAEAYYDAHNRATTGTKAEADDGYRLEPVPDIEAHRADYDILSWDMAPGDCLLFHALTLHGAPGNPNATEARRFVTRWVGSTAVLAPHGEEIVTSLQKLGFDVQIGPGDPIRGNMFPLLP